MGIDEKRGARTGRNVKLSLTISQEAAEIVEKDIARNIKGVRKPGKSDTIDKIILEWGAARK
jgi:hypothetical protein